MRTEATKRAQQRYANTAKGKAARARALAKYYQTDKYKESQRKACTRKRAKAKLERLPFEGDTRRKAREATRGYCLLPSNHPAFIHKPKHDLPHRRIAENVLGRRLKRTEVVHHINGDHNDNRNCNLLVCSNVYHSWLHSKLRGM
jgi:hypothetical protein